MRRRQDLSNKMRCRPDFLTKTSWVLCINQLIFGRPIVRLFSPLKRVSLDSLSPITASSLFDVGVDTGVWVCVVLGVECSVSRRVINYHAGNVIGSEENRYLAATARMFPFAGRVIALSSLHLVKKSSHGSQGWYIIAINRFLSLRVFVSLNSVLTFSHDWTVTRFSAVRYIGLIS